MSIHSAISMASTGSTRFLRGRAVLASVALLAAAGSSAAQVGPYPNQYDPTRILEVDLAMDPADWDLIRFDQTYTLEVAAMMSVGGEAPLLVGVRRKSATALPSELDPQKISMKIDVNQFVPGQAWHGVKKLSLENGDDVNIITEGFAWYLHRLATGFAGSSYRPGLAAWVQVTVNGQDLGVYVNVEQPDKSFLKNRGIYTSGETWLYKQYGATDAGIKVGLPDSPTYQALCYQPFRRDCGPPSAAEFVSELNELIDMQALMTMGAIGAFTSNPDAIFSKGKNFYVADFLSGAKRTCIPWDLDAAINNRDPDKSIYETATGPGRYEDLIVNNPAFRPLYDATMQGLLDGPFQEATLLAFLDQAEALLSGPLAADPHNQLDPSTPSVSDFFDSLRAWVPARIANVQSQLPPPAGGVPAPATSPDPADGAIAVGLSAALGWSAGVGASSHDVYFGTNPTPGAAELQGNQTATLFEPGPLLEDTTYYWRVDEVNQYGATTGDVWSFTTQTGPGVLTLNASGHKEQGRWTADLAWAGATTSTVDIFRDGVFLVTVDNTGAYTDRTTFRGGGSLTYEVCEPGGACSNAVTIQF